MRQKFYVNLKLLILTLNYLIDLSFGLEILRNVGADDFTLKPKWFDESEELYEVNSIENKRNIESKFSKLNQQQSSKPQISKIYLKNVTLFKGDMAILRCHQLNEHKQNGNLKNKQIRADSNYLNNHHKRNHSNFKTYLDDSLSIKTIIWSYETSTFFPKLLTNNDEVLMKSKRFNMLNSSKKSKNDNNEDYAIKQIKKSNYDLKICPVKVSDSGWYSCYVVKKSSQDQNIKYFTYLNVLDSHDKSRDYDENLDIDLYYNDDYDFDAESIELIKEKIDRCSRMSQHEYNNLSHSKEKTKSSTTLKADEYSKTSDILSNNQEVIKDNKNDNVDDEILFFDEFSKNTTLKRQIENELKLKESQNLIKNSLIVSTTSTFSSPLTSTYSPTITKTIINHITTTQLVTTTKNNNDIETQGQSSISSLNNDLLNNQKSKIIKERLTISPRYMNASQFKSFQFDCAYHGYKYSHIDLIWSKNGQNLDLVNHNRILAIQYKQNNTKISILKFSYALLTDAGIYNCSVVNSSNKKRLFSEVAQLVMHHSRKSADDKNFKYSSYLESDTESNALKLSFFNQSFYSFFLTTLLFKFLNMYFYNI